jgi:hypothetical protein
MSCKLALLGPFGHPGIPAGSVSVVALGNVVIGRSLPAVMLASAGLDTRSRVIPIIIVAAQNTRRIYTLLAIGSAVDVNARLLPTHMP